MALNLDSYLAGVFDSEGTVVVYVSTNEKRQGGTQIRIVVKMTDRIALRLFAKRFGGSVRPERGRNIRLPHIKPIYLWTLCGKKSVEALQTLSQLCLIKAAQLKLALEAMPLLMGKRFFSVPQDNMQRRIELAKEIARLKRIPVDDALGV